MCANAHGGVPYSLSDAIIQPPQSGGVLNPHCESKTRTKRPEKSAMNQILSVWSPLFERVWGCKQTQKAEL
jgi:hypothetical protein